MPVTVEGVRELPGDYPSLTSALGEALDLTPTQNQRVTQQSKHGDSEFPMHFGPRAGGGIGANSSGAGGAAGEEGEGGGGGGSEHGHVSEPVDVGMDSDVSQEEIDRMLDEGWAGNPEDEAERLYPPDHPRHPGNTG